ncbi:hypothetical protein E2C01_082127 [Portunus trituberculatus]|uniref:Uncharacterized protein n=1 Tax=Portunus trituberculatus TaxID=210409 RepID=A0A5B7IRJ6_PORTR|nr:hypothetical protein [Portunus trituberculatus]
MKKRKKKYQRWIRERVPGSVGGSSLSVSLRVLHLSTQRLSPLSLPNRVPTFVERACASFIGAPGGYRTPL